MPTLEIRTSNYAARSVPWFRITIVWNWIGESFWVYRFLGSEEIVEAFFSRFKQECVSVPVEAVVR